MTELETIKITKEESFPAEENPFNHDHYNMGKKIGTNVTVMFGNYENMRCPYLYVINTKTGERIKIEFKDSKEAEVEQTIDKTMQLVLGGFRI